MIEARDLVFRYQPEEQPAVDGVSIRVERGEIVGVIGPNGSGKSTLSRLIKGLLLPECGSVQVNGIDTRADSLQVRRLVGLVFQNPNSQIVNAVVENEVAFGPENLGLPTSEIRERVDAALRTVGLEDQDSAECHNLTMADKQRVAIAAVMAMQPQYLILDEPTAWLEPVARWQLLRAVLDWSADHGVGLILVTHRMDEAQVCGRVYGMLRGRVEVTGTSAEILQDEDIRQRLSLAVPEAFVLVDELRAAGLPVRKDASLEVVAAALCQS
jgi:energy-coupling factor transport system ATP-binding protein